MKGVWEAGSYSSKSASNRPRTVLIVNANSTPEDIKFDRGVKSKVSCIATPQDRLSHPQKLAITKQMVKDAKENHVQLPGILGYGKCFNKLNCLGTNICSYRTPINDMCTKA